MSLFSSLQIANNALIAQQIGLQVTGNNVANANTPGYIREQVLFEAATTQQSGQLLLGSGVDVAAIVQKTDRYLAERVRGASADLANGEAQEQTYVQLESIVAELGDTDLSTTLGKFFSSIHDVLNQPESLSVRNVAIQQGQRLTDDIRRLDTRVRAVRAPTVDVPRRGVRPWVARPRLRDSGPRSAGRRWTRSACRAPCRCSPRR